MLDDLDDHSQLSIHSIRPAIHSVRCDDDCTLRKASRHAK